ncbi:MAG: hypothetical protein IJH21_03140 [Oscillospiraceae bacterium]|nr:hypothetical protein [Oscillospiraceae bacterium]
MKVRKKRKQELKPSSYILLSEFAELDRVILDIDPEEYERRAEELTARLDALALEDPKEATAIFQQSSFFVEYMEENQIYLSSSCWITKEQLIELNTPEKRAAYLAEESRAFDEAFEAGKHMLIGSGGFVVLDD